MSDIPHAWPTLSLPGLRGRPYALPRLATATLVKLCVALMLLTATVGALLALVRSIAAPGAQPPVAIPSIPAPSARWIDIVKPVHLYDLTARDVSKLPSTYSARRLDPGSSREDRLDFGVWHADQLSLHITILREGVSSSVSLDTAIVRQAADLGLAVSHSTLPDTMKTRFGAFEIADVAATRGASTGPAMACSGFRLSLPAPRFAVDGFACGAEGRPLPRKALACLIDRLDLVSAGEDRALIDFFASTELRRDRDCDGMRLGPDAAHAPWLDTTDDPAPAAGRPAKHHRTRHRH